MELEILRADIPTIERNYKHSSPTTWGWSCSICGDSKKDRRKARFGVSIVKNELLCNCFNCGWSGTFKMYLQYQHPDLYQRLQRQKFVEHQSISAETYNDTIIDKCDSETLVELYYINSESNLKRWLSLLIEKKIKIHSKNNQQKLVDLHKRYHNEQ